MLYINELNHRSYLKACFFLLCCLSSILAKADYKPMLKDGRVWNYIEVYEKSVYVDFDGNIVSLDDERWETEYDEWYTIATVIDTTRIAYRINGTETFDNRLCYKLYSGNYFLRYCYEENGKVYAWNDDKWVEGYDFTLEVGEACPFRPQMTVKSVDTIRVAGEDYRRLWFGYSDNEGKWYWIEGMGSTQHGPFFSTEPETYPFSQIWRGIVSVYDGDTCLFEREDFHRPGIAPGADAVNSVSSDADHKVSYDLLGRRLSQKPERGVYIQDGKKYVVK